MSVCLLFDPLMYSESYYNGIFYEPEWSLRLKRQLVISELQYLKKSSSSYDGYFEI